MTAKLAVLILSTILTLFLVGCGEAEEPADEETTEEVTEVEETDTEVVEEETEVTETDSTEVTEAELEEVEEDNAAVEREITLVALPEPWPEDFPILSVYEIVSNETLEDGSQVLLAMIPSEDRPSFWDLGYYFRDDIEGWDVAEEDTWDCMLSDFNFTVPLSQGNAHIFCEGYWDDSRSYPGPTPGWVPVETIAAFLEPVYIAQLPLTDGWENPILYWSDGRSYRILSMGRDGRIDRDWTRTVEPLASIGHDADIVFGDGGLLAWPLGAKGR